jgi:hypothetical protein
MRSSRHVHDELGEARLVQFYSMCRSITMTSIIHKVKASYLAPSGPKLTPSTGTPNCSPRTAASHSSRQH